MIVANITKPLNDQSSIRYCSYRMVNNLYFVFKISYDIIFSKRIRYFQKWSYSFFVFRDKFLDPYKIYSSSNKNVRENSKLPLYSSLFLFPRHSTPSHSIYLTSFSSPAPTRFFLKMPRLDDSIKGETIDEDLYLYGAVRIAGMDWPTSVKRGGPEVDVRIKRQHSNFSFPFFAQRGEISTVQAGGSVSRRWFIVDSRVNYFGSEDYSSEILNNWFFQFSRAISSMAWKKF